MDWIKTSERLPKHNQNVLGLVKGSRFSYPRVVFFLESFKEIAEEYDEFQDVDLDEDENAYWKSGWYEELEQFQHEYDFVWTTRNITHWMPLPEPPKD